MSLLSDLLGRITSFKQNYGQTYAWIQEATKRIDAETAATAALNVRLTKLEKEVAALPHSVLFPPSGQIPTALLPRFGGATGSYITVTASDAEINAEVDAWNAVRCKWLRIDLLDSAPFQTRFGKALTRMEGYGMKMMACLHGTTDSGLSPASAADFATRMAAAWGSRISVWSFVNEPNLPHAAPRWTTALYIPAYTASRNAIKAALPNAPYAAGVLGWETGGDISNFWNGINGSIVYDACDVHCYETPSGSNWTEAMTLNTGGKPFLITESGSAGGSQSTIVPAALVDTRAQSVATYCQSTNESAGYAMTVPTQAAYLAAAS